MKAKFIVSVLVAALLSVLLVPDVQASPNLVLAQSTPDETPPDTVHFVIDVSGSMYGQSLEEAKTAVRDAATKLSPTQTAGLRSFSGYCQGGGGRLLHAPTQGAGSAIISSLGYLNASGGTPTPAALRAAAADIANAPGKKTIVLVSDGGSTCGNPCPVAEAIKQSAGVDLNMVTVGFRTDRYANEELECIARVTQGKFVTADNVQALSDILTGVVKYGPSSIVSSDFTAIPICLNSYELLSSKADPATAVGDYMTDSNGVQRVVVNGSNCNLGGHSDVCLTSALNLGEMRECIKNPQTLAQRIPQSTNKWNIPNPEAAPVYSEKMRYDKSKKLGVPTTCPDVVFVGARGSGEASGAGKREGGVYDNFATKAGSPDTNITTEYRYLDYPAAGVDVITQNKDVGKYLSSIDHGQRQLVFGLNKLAQECDSRIVLSGYSQGALVIRLALSNSSLNPGALEKIGGIALLSDPAKYQMARGDALCRGECQDDGLHHRGGGDAGKIGIYHSLLSKGGQALSYGTLLKAKPVPHTEGLRMSWCVRPDPVCGFTRKTSVFDVDVTNPGTWSKGKGVVSLLKGLENAAGWGHEKLKGTHSKSYDSALIQVEAATELHDALKALLKGSN